MRLVTAAQHGMVTSTMPYFPFPFYDDMLREAFKPSLKGFCPVDNQAPPGAISMDLANTMDEGVMEPYATGEVVAVQSAVPYVPPPPPFMARGFEYYMNGRHTGRLYLDHVHHRCAWSSNTTGRTTDWHGEWHVFASGTLVCIFDFDGREDMRQHVAIFPGSRGTDYQGRKIRVEQAGLWQYDRASREYVRRS